MDFSRIRLLVIAPHPDDEVLGCGGLITKVNEAGGQVYVLFLTVGDTMDFSQKGSSSARERIKEIKMVAKYLQFRDYELAFVGNGHHLKLDVLGQKELMELIERKSKVAIETVKPTLVAFPSVDSYNQDHRMAAWATQAALRPAELTTKHLVRYVMAYEVPADYWRMHNCQEPNFFVPLAGRQLKTKLAAMDLYQSQVRPKPNPRAGSVVRALAQLRGSQCGAGYAEGFVCYRSIS